MIIITFTNGKNPATTTADDPPEVVLGNLLAQDLAAAPLGVQLAFKQAAAEVKQLLLAGQISDAREVIATWPIPPELAALQTQLLSRFPAS